MVAAVSFGNNTECLASCPIDLKVQVCQSRKHWNLVIALNNLDCSRHCLEISGISPFGYGTKFQRYLERGCSIYLPMLKVKQRNAMQIDSEQEKLNSDTIQARIGYRYWMAPLPLEILPPMFLFATTLLLHTSDTTINATRSCGNYRFM